MNCNRHVGGEEELGYQAARAARISALEPTPQYIFDRYRENRHWRLFPKEYMFKVLGGLNGKTVLDFGCGEGELTTQLAKFGAFVTGVDISPELIQIARNRSQLDGVSDRVQFHVGDVLESPPHAEYFDILICNAVLHHLDLRKTVPVLMRCVKPGGIAIFVEPIALSPSLQKFRDMLPVKKDVSPGEHQLNGSDLAFIREQIESPRTKYFDCLGRLSRFLPHFNQIDQGHPLTKFAAVLLLSIDRFLIETFPLLRRYSGMFVILGRKPA